MKDPSLFIIESIFQSIQFRFLAISKIPEQNVSPWFVKMTSRSLILLSKISVNSHLTIVLTVVRAAVAKKLQNSKHRLSNVFEGFPSSPYSSDYLQDYLLRSSQENKLSIYLEWLTCDI